MEVLSFQFSYARVHFAGQRSENGKGIYLCDREEIEKKDKKRTYRDSNPRHDK